MFHMLIKENYIILFILQKKFNLIINYKMFTITFVMFISSLIFLVNSQICGPKEPTIPQDCLASSELNTKKVCCFAEVTSVNKDSNIPLTSKNICLLIPINKIFLAPYLTQMDLGISNENIKISLNCGHNINSLRAFEQCGPETPKNFDDCNGSSTSTSSCCYLQSENGNATCLLNPGISNQNKTYFGVVVACKEKFVKFNYFLYIIFFIGILITI